MSLQERVDPQVMQELLERPGIQEFVAKMTPEELAWYKDLLVKQGIYARYGRERWLWRLMAVSGSIPG